MQISRLVLLAISVFTMTQLNAQKSKISQLEFLGSSDRIDAIVANPTNEQKKAEYKNLVKKNFEFNNTERIKLLNGIADPVLQVLSDEKNAELLDLEIYEGINRTQGTGVTPPDPSSDIGKDFLVETSNSSGGSIVLVCDKNGTPLMDPFTLNNLWSQFGFVGFGDPIVLYDQIAERWVISEFASIVDNTMLIAISQTSDPLGGYYAYAFTTPTFPDYPKFGIWNDAYIMTSNEPENFIPIYAFERRALLNGDPSARMVRMESMVKFSTPAAFQVASPVDMTGNNPPPAASPHYSVRMQDDTWVGNPDVIEVWATNIDWDNTDNIDISLHSSVEVSDFNVSQCNTLFDCFPQFGGATISALEHVIMNRVQYRNYGTHESILLNFTVDATGLGQAGIRWIELRKTGDDPWGLFQEGTIFGDDGLARFMGSIGMDASGNIALAYAITNDTTPLSLRMTGRLADDPLGMMTLPETEIVAGAGANDSPRWGDYFSMSIDPIDDRSFWFTGEYMISQGQWGTKNVKFKLQRDSLDLAPKTLVSPMSSATLGSDEQVTVTISNIGEKTIDSFEVSLRLDGTFIVADQVQQILQPGESYDHTFSMNVNLEEKKLYAFQIEINAMDDNRFNDILNVEVEKPKRLDLQLNSLGSVPAIICSDEVEIPVSFTNLGEETITNFDIVVLTNGANPETFMWTGSLLKGQTETFVIMPGNFEIGVNMLDISLMLPNGEMDEDGSNNSRGLTFEYTDEGMVLDFSFTSDFFGSETTWNLATDQGDIVVEGGPYPNGGASDMRQFCVNEGCYVFIILDSYGDGLNSPFLEDPDYELKNEDGIILAKLSDLDFGFSESTEFCLPFVCLLDFDVSIMDESADGEMDGRIDIMASNFLEPVMYSIDDGITFGDVSIFENLPAGDYEIVVKDARLCEARMTVTIDLLNSLEELPEGVSLNLYPNPTDSKTRIFINGIDAFKLPFELLDANGKILQRRNAVKYGNEHTAEVSLLSYPAGMYYLRFRSNEFNHILRIIKE